MKRKTFNNLQEEFKKKDNIPYFFSRKSDIDGLDIALNNFSAAFIHKIRRTGKTTFLIHDFAFAKQDDYNIFYYSFFNDSKNTLNDFKYKLLLFFEKLLNVKEEDSIKRVFDSNFRFEDMKDKISLSFDLFLFKGKINKEKKENNKIDNDKFLENLQLVDIFQKVTSQLKDGKILLLLDEIQEVSKHNNGLGFIKDLRTALDINKFIFRTVFTGSSYYGIQNMFKNYKEPLYRFGYEYDFEDLDKDFSDFCCEKFNEKTQLNLNKDDLFHFFKHNKFLPYKMVECLTYLEIKKTDDLNSFIELKAKNNNYQEYETIFNKLSVIEQLILKRIIIEDQKITSLISLEWFKQKYLEETGKVSKNMKRLILNSTNKLKEREIIYKKKQEWFFTEQNFKEYVLSIS